MFGGAGDAEVLGDYAGGGDSGVGGGDIDAAVGFGCGEHGLRGFADDTADPVEVGRFDDAADGVVFAVVFGGAIHAEDEWAGDAVHTGGVDFGDGELRVGGEGFYDFVVGGDDGCFAETENRFTRRILETRRRRSGFPRARWKRRESLSRQVRPAEGEVLAAMYFGVLNSR